VDGRWIIDADSHLTEPADVWTARVPAKYVDRVPHVERTENGVDVWILDGTQIATVGQTAPGPNPLGQHVPPNTYEECHPAAYIAEERLRYMDRAGIWAQVLYPNVGGVGSQKFRMLREPDLQFACVRAYNDFLQEWTSADPNRLIGVMAIPFWDIEESIREIRRGHDELGMRAILFTGEPMRFGLPTLGDRHWDPLWSVAQDLKMPIHFHIGGGEDAIDTFSAGAAKRREHHGLVGSGTYAAIDLFMKNGVQCGDLITSGVLPRFSDLKFVSVESGCGWLPFVLETADYTWLGITRKGRIRAADDVLPSDLFRRQVYVTVWFEQIAPRRLLDEIPLDNLLFETDFPHNVCLYGNIRETISAAFRGVTEEVRSKILWNNAATLYSIEEPSHSPPELVGT
jgi:predicted TIM-barrel fold metal-dependent hydrolase